MEQSTFIRCGLIAVAAYTLHKIRRNYVGKRIIRLGTRSSDLAMVQTHWVAANIERANPDIRVIIKQGIDSFGDRVLNQSLKDLAAKNPGLFTKELEIGLLHNMYDAVVHSLKDMPTTLPNGLTLAAITEREDPRDAVVLHAKHKNLSRKNGDCLAKLPPGSVVGTSSVRREAIIRRDYPQLKIELIRGNVNTRLAKLDRGEFDAIILAVAGLVRLGPQFEKRIDQVVDENKFRYGVSQGSLGLECRAKDFDTINVLKSIEHVPSSNRCIAERALLRTLEGGCQVPLGVTTKIDQYNILSLACTVLSSKGTSSMTSSICGKMENARALGETLAHQMLKLGAKGLMSSMHDGPTRQLTYGSAAQPNVGARG